MSDPQADPVLLASNEGGSVAFTLAAPTKCSFKFETIGQDVVFGTPLRDAYLPASLQRTDVVANFNVEPAVRVPPAVPVDQGQVIDLDRGTYELRLLDLRQGRLTVLRGE